MDELFADIEEVDKMVSPDAMARTRAILDEILRQHEDEDDEDE